MNGLAALAALPAIWVGRDADYVLETLLDALLSALKADFVCAILQGPKPKSRIRGRSGLTPAHNQLLLALAGTFGDDTLAWPPAGEISVGADAISILSAPMGLQGEVGVVVAGTRRRDFDYETGGLLLGAAANQGALALQAVRRSDQQKQIASDLDERVTQRTAELARANEALRFAARESREIVDSIPTLVGLLSPTGQVELVNRQIHEYTGRSTEELEKWGMSDLVHGDDLPGALDSFAAGFASGEPFEITYRMRRHDGIYRWFEGLHHPLKDDEGRIVRWCVSCNDIEDRKQVEDALREKERTWRSVINGIPGLTATLSPGGMVEAVNRQIVDYTGCELDELRAWGSNGIVHPEDMPHVAEIFGRAIAAGASYEIEQRLRRFDGEYRWFSNRGTPALDAAGQVVRWYVLLVDIHEARLVADALRSSEDNARSIVSSIAGMIAVFTADGQLCGGNQQLLDFFEQPLEEVGRWATNGTTHPDDLQYCIDTFMGSIVSGEPYNYETRFKRADGVWRWFNISGQPLRDATGQIVRWYGLLADIDDRKRAEEAMLKSEREARLVVDTIPGLIVYFTAEGVTEGCNPQLLEYMGQTFEEFSNWGTNGTVHPDDMPHAMGTFVGSLASGRDYEMEARLRRFDGEFRWFKIRGRAVKNPSGNVERWYGLLTDIDDQKRFEVTLAAREHEMRAMLDSIGVGIGVISPDSKVIGANRQMLDYFGITLDELQKWGSNDLIHPDDLPGYREYFQKWMSSTDQPPVASLRLRRHDGVYRWHSSTNTAHKDETGRVIRWYGVTMDVDDQKLAEEAVAASERNLQVTVDTIPALVWSARNDGTADFFNRHYLEYVGKTAEELSGWAWTAAVHPDDISELGAVWEMARETGGGAECEARLRGANGSHRWFIFRAHPLLDENGKVVKWYGINIDIEDRKAAEEELRRSEASLAEAQRLSSLGSFTWHLETGVIEFSEELYRVFEFDRHSPVTIENIAGRVHADDLALLNEKVALARRGINDHEYEIRAFMPDGRVKYLRTASRSAVEAGGTSVFRGSIQDVTPQRLAEEALNELRAELAHVSRVSTLGAMTASIAHEVNQPLAGIITNASTCLRMLAMDPPDIEGALETARRSIRDGNRAAEVITRLRAMFRKTNELSETVDLNEAARDVIELAGSELRRSRVELETSLAADLPPVIGDRVQLQQVILNLLLNAADALSAVRDRPRRALLKTSEDEDGNVRLTVQDSGVGIDPDSSIKIFDAFYTTKASGMGIGLSVSRSIIERHGGRIWASVNDGPGASFSFAVPRSPNRSAEGGAAALSARMQLHSGGEGQ